MDKKSERPKRKRVTPLAGVWVEMDETIVKNHPWTESLPLRECGLKLTQYGLRIRTKESLPLRECGLKSCRSSVDLDRRRSLPLRECGLKSQAEKEELRHGKSHSPCGSVG